MNLHDGLDEANQNNLSRALQLLQEEKPDVISLQEIERKQLKIFEAAGYQVVSGMNHNLFLYHFGNAILTRHKIIYRRHHYLPSNREQRGMDEAAIDANGTIFILLNLHLGLGQWEQNQQFTEVRRIIGYLKGPIIVCGDFNVLSPDELFAEFNQDFQEIGSAIPLANSFPSSSPRERMDLIWYSRHWQPLKAQVISWNGSDHLPVEGELQLNEAPVNPIIEEEVPEIIQDNNPLLPNVNQPLTELSVAMAPAESENRMSASLTLPVLHKLGISGKYNGSRLISALNYHWPAFDLRDYLSKWRIRGQGEWITSIGTDTHNDAAWLSWEQYYRWSNHGGSRIIISNQNQKISCAIEQLALLSPKLGLSISMDSSQKLAVGIAYTPDYRHVLGSQLNMNSMDPHWRLRWRYQYY